MLTIAKTYWFWCCSMVKNQRTSPLYAVQPFVASNCNHIHAALCHIQRNMPNTLSTIAQQKQVIFVCKIAYLCHFLPMPRYVRAVVYAQQKGVFSNVFLQFLRRNFSVVIGHSHAYLTKSLFLQLHNRP